MKKELNNISKRQKEFQDKMSALHIDDYIQKIDDIKLKLDNKRYQKIGLTF